jgi:ribose transport system permease protein
MNAQTPVAAATPTTRGWREALIRNGFLFVMAACFVFFAAYNPNFLGVGNFKNIAEGSAVLLVVSLGMTLVLAQGGIDLSVGVALDFGSAFAIVAMKQFDVVWWAAIVIGVLAGAAVGLLNAVLVVRLAVSPFLATLGVYFIGGSVERIFTNGGGPISFRQVAANYYAIGVGEIFGVPLKVVIAAALALIYYLVLERSILGKRIHAVGMQPTAARVAGLKVSAYAALGFVAASATCAIGGIIASASLRMFTPLAGNAYLMNAIAAAFIGASIHPRGRPNVFGTVLGVLFLGMVANGLDLMGLDFNLKDALSGIILVVALTLAVAQRGFRR